MDKPKSERPNTWFRELHCHRQPVGLQYWRRNTTDVHKFTKEWEFVTKAFLGMKSFSAAHCKHLERKTIARNIITFFIIEFAVSLNIDDNREFCDKETRRKFILGNQRRLNWIAKNKAPWAKRLGTKWNWWFNKKDMIFGCFFEWICWSEHERRRKEIQLATTLV